MHRLCVSHLFIATIIGASGCSNHPVTPYPSEPDDRIIAFSSDSGSGHGISIFLMHADGTHKVRLTDDGAFDGTPTWSHDGQMIEFDSDRSGGVATSWAMNADGSDVHFLADGYGARWSPDGTKLVYTGQTPDENYVVYIANADGSSPRRLTTNLRGEVRPAWSPDGAHIIYSAYPVGEDMNLYVVNADGTNERQLTHTTGFSQDAVWSPDGTRIAFEHGAPYQLAAIHVIDIDGTNDRTLTALGCSQPSWSPDSREIAYVCTHGEPARLYRMNADGSEKRVLTASGISSNAPSWKPAP